MSLNLNQIPTAAASILSTDKMYIARSPFDVTSDRYILGSSIISQFGTPLTTKGDLYTFTTVPARLPVGLDGQLLQAASGQATGLIWTTATYPATTTINQLLYSSAANTVSGLITANNGVLITSAGGVPSIGSTLPSAVQSNITSLGTITSGTWNGSIVTVPFGGTGNTTFTAFSVLCAGTTATGAFQNVSGVGTSGQVLTSNGAGLLPTWQATGEPPSAALTAGNDTNVTLTLGGSPATALLQATSITAGWTGQLSLTRGGTNASLVASTGGIVYSGASALAILSGTATANQVLLSGSSAAPSWSTATYPATTTINQLLYSSSANTIVGLATANNGVLITSAGGVPSISSTLPAAVQGNITSVGTITSGTWNGSIIALAFGGSNANLTASNGGIVWSNASQMQILAGTATANQMLQSGSTATPAWSTSTWPATTTANQLLYSSFNNTVAGLTSGNDGVLITSHTGVPSWLANGTAGFVLTANTNAPPSWQANGNGTVTSVATGLGLTGGPITTTGTVAVTGVLADIVNNVIAPVKNLIMGGNFDTNPWQRGTSFPAALGIYTADRINYSQSGTGVVTIQKTADAPTVAQAGIFSTNCLDVNVTTAEAVIIATDAYVLSYFIEGYDWAQIAQRIFTISFWVKSTVTGIYSLSVSNNVNRTYVAEYTVNTTNTWEKKTITITASPSGGTWNYTNGIGLRIRWIIAAGSNNFTGALNTWNSDTLIASSNQVNGVSTNGNHFKLQLIQCEAGSEANGFQVRSEMEELSLCQRYYQKSFPQGVAVAQNAGVTGAISAKNPIALGDPSVYITFKQTMRTTPTITTYNPSAGNANWRDITAASDVTVSVDPGSTLADSGVLIATSGTIANLGDILAIHYSADAEF